MRIQLFVKDFNSIIFFASETHMMNGEVETDENIPAEEVEPEVSNIFSTKKKFCGLSGKI